MAASYAGIGSRGCPADICSLMTDIARFLCNQGIVLRSGGANGADSAFEAGVDKEEMKEIYLPWPAFNNNRSQRWGVNARASLLAEEHHPAWRALGFAAKKLIARNGFQVLGESLEDPVKFIVCWTKDGRATGGTGQAIRIAKSKDIPVFNLFRKDDLKHVLECMKTHQVFA